MNNKQLPLLLVFFISTFAFSQQKWFHYNGNPKNKHEIDFLCDQAFNFDVGFYKNDVRIGATYEEFAYHNVLYLYEDLCLENIYRSFEGKEAYIFKILKTIVKDSSQLRNVRVFFYRDGAINASMNESGIIRLNVGAMARLKNEAELAILLGHELAHFKNSDVAKTYERAHDSNPFNDGWQGSWRWTHNGMTLVLRHNDWYNREQEETADFTAFQYLKETPYSLQSASNLERIFKREDIRLQIKHGKQATWSRTHPDPADRLKMIKDLSASSTQGKKNFVVDSLEFMKLKELCYMETVNIAFSQNDLEDLINMAFSRYLMEPDNEYNLAVLIEALRRIILFNDSKIMDKSFILYPYQTNQEGASGNYAFLKEKNPSILNYLSKGFIDVWKEEMSLIKATELVDPHTIEFTTVSEAYAYFKKKALEKKFLVAEHYKYFGAEANFSGAASYQSANSIFLTNEYITRNTTKVADSSKLIVTLPFSAYALLSVFELKNIKGTKEAFNSDLANHIKTNQPKYKVITPENLTFGNQHMIQDFIKICRNEMDFGPGLIYRSKKNWLEIYPEIYGLFKKYNVPEIYFCVPYVSYVDEAASKGARTVVMYFKISKSSKTKTTVSGIEKDWSINALKDGDDFFKKINNQLTYFIAATKND